MATGMAEYEASIAALKRRLFAQLLSSLPAGTAGEAGAAQPQPAQLLELGIGTGPNLPFYSAFYGLPGRQGASSSGGDGSNGSGSSTVSTGSSSSLSADDPPLQIVGVDPNPFMRQYLEDSRAAVGWPQARLSWVQGRAEALPLPDASCDAVVCTLVLCSVGDVARLLDEMARVLRPGGSLLFIEHTTARLQAQPVLWVGQRALEPLQRLLADNCHLTRDPLPAIEAHPAFRGGVEATRFSVDGVSLISPHVAGIARRQGQRPPAAEAEEQDWLGGGQAGSGATAA
ncbi:hypothetical protein ABPG75_011954 [Micractinium tetrahymenae]